MHVCRICLAHNIKKDISELESALSQTTSHNTSCVDIMLFCLDIQVSRNSQVSTKLCSKCYKKVLSFHKFKTLALKSDAYLRSLDTTLDKNDLDNNENEVYVVKEETEYVTSPEYNLDDDYGDDLEVKKEIKEEIILNELPSDDEFLSVLKKVKYGNAKEETKENAALKRKRKKKKQEKLNDEKFKICDECGKLVRDLTEHMKRHKTGFKKIPCKLCEKQFSSYSARYKHVKIKHYGIKKQCSICKKYVVYLKKHLLVIHHKEQLQFPCPVCDRKFISQSVLDQHMTTHTKERRFECDICNNKYRTDTLLKLHKRNVHDKERTHLCQFCSKGFFKKYHLQIHLRSHTKERPHPCPECGKCYSSTTTLKSHMLIHRGTRDFHCKLCDMTFAKPNYLRAHMVSHTKERRYPCQYCGVGFGRSDHRKRHENTVHAKLRAAISTPAPM